MSEEYAYPQSIAVSAAGGVYTSDVYTSFAVKEQSGMTLRDYMAAKAMQGILASPANFTIEGDTIEYGGYTISKLAYLYADAMMDARKK